MCVQDLHHQIDCRAAKKREKKEEEENRGGEMLFQKNVLFCCLHQDLKGKQRKVSRSVDLFLVFFLIDLLIVAQNEFITKK